MFKNLFENKDTSRLEILLTLKTAKNRRDQFSLEYSNIDSRCEERREDCIEVTIMTVRNVTIVAEQSLPNNSRELGRVSGGFYHPLRMR